MKAQLLIAAHCDEPQELGDDHIEVWGYSRPSPEHADRNEDAAAVWLRPNGGVLLAVADGMGGTPQGTESAAIAIRALDTGIRAAESHDDLRSTILDAFEAANREIMEQFGGSGTTLVVSEIQGGVVRTYNVGDSAAILMGQRGRIKLETIAHSPVGYGVAAGLLDAEAAFAHEERHFLLNHVGSESMHVEVGTARALARRDTLVLASDGLLDNVAFTELVDIARCGPLRKAAARLVELSTERMDGADANVPGKPDDLTFLLLRRARP